MTGRPGRFALAIAGGLVTSLAFPLVVPWLSLDPLDPGGAMEWLAWIGLVPLILAVEAATGPAEALLLGFAAGMAAFYAVIYWVSHAMTAFGGLSAGIAFVGLTLLVAYMAAHWALATWGSWLVRRRLGIPTWAQLPVVWVATELLRNYLFTGFPWGHVGYTQARHPIVAQLAALGGVHAVGGLVVLVNCVAAAWWTARRGRAPRPLAATAVAGALVAGALAWGVVHLRSVRAEMAVARTVRVGLVQANVNQNVKNQGSRHAERIVGRMWPLTEQADRAGADLVAWPEASWPVAVPPDLASLATMAPRVAPLARAHVLLGVSTLRWVTGPERRRLPEVQNSAFLLAPDLRVEDRYVKHHLVPYGEYVPLRGWLPFLRSVVPDMAPTSAGTRLTPMTLDAPGGAVRIAPMICFDAIFPEVTRAFARAGADLLVNPTNDAWYGYSSGPHQFLAIVQMRAVESRRSVARPAYSGVSALVWPTGEVAPGALGLGPVDPERAPDPDAPPRLLVGDLPVLRESTPYTRFGDLFAGACATAAALLVAVALSRRGRP